MKSRQYLWRAGWLSIAVSLTACGGGGGGGAGGSSPTDTGGATAPATVRIAGAALVPSTQVGKPAEAAPDGAQVELISTAGSTSKSLATTAVKAGRFQFDVQGATLGANTLVQLNVGGALYRAPAFTNEVDVSPHSEAVLSTVNGEKLRAGMISAQEYDALLQGSQWLAELARLDPAATAATLSPANLQRVLAADANYAAYLKAAELDNATTAVTLADLGDLMPVSYGTRWQYRDEAGQAIPLFNAGAASNETYDIRSELTQNVIQRWTRKADGIYSSGGSVQLNGSAGVVTIALGEQLIMPFPAKLGMNRTSTGAATQVVRDIDGDNKAESAIVTWSLEVQAIETQTVLGVPTATLRVGRKLTGKLTLSTDASVGALTVDETYWLAPRMGVVRSKSTTTIDHPLLKSTQTKEQTLHAFASDAKVPLRFTGGAMRYIPLAYAKLVTDLPRRRVLALLNGDELAKGHSLASINIDTGEVTYSALSVGGLDELAVAPTGEVFAAISTGNPDDFSAACASVSTILRLNGTSLQEEARYSPAKGASSSCAPGKVTFMQALSASTVIVQARQRMASELIRLDNGVRASDDINSGNAYFPLYQPFQQVFVVGDDAYLVSSSTSYRAKLTATGFGRPDPLWSLGFNSAVMPWMVGTTIRGSYQQFDIVSGLTTDAGLGQNYCGLQGVPGHPEWAACGVGNAHFIDFATYEWATGRVVSSVSLPWSIDAWTGMLERGLIFDEWTIIHPALASTSWDATSKHTGLYVSVRDKN